MYYPLYDALFEGNTESKISHQYCEKYLWDIFADIY